VPVILRLTTRICHVKGLVASASANAREPAGFVKNAAALGDGAGAAKAHSADVRARRRLRAEAETSPLNVIEAGQRPRVGFVTSGPAYMHVAKLPRCAGAQARLLLSPVPFEPARSSPRCATRWWWSRRSSR
jgi:indolepyruvate ferredoxin oxidoreductase alpha subunit